MKTERKFNPSRVVSIFTENFGLSWTLSLVVVCFISLVTCFAVFWFSRREHLFEIFKPEVISRQEAEQVIELYHST